MNFFFEPFISQIQKVTFNLTTILRGAGGQSSVMLVDKDGLELHSDGRDSDGGTNVVAIELHDAQMGTTRRALYSYTLYSHDIIS